MIHPLRKYLFLNEIQAKDFAERIDYNKMTISHVCNSHKPPSRRLAKAIEKETGGIVKVSDLIEYHELKKLEKQSHAQLDIFDCENLKESIV